jgi:hypothetical protein
VIDPFDKPSPPLGAAPGALRDDLLRPGRSASHHAASLAAAGGCV